MNEATRLLSLLKESHDDVLVDINTHSNVLQKAQESLENAAIRKQKIERLQEILKLLESEKQEDMELTHSEGFFHRTLEELGTIGNELILQRDCLFLAIRNILDKI